MVQADGSTFDDMVNLRDPSDPHHNGHQQHLHNAADAGRGAPSASHSGASPASASGGAHGSSVPHAHLGGGGGGGGGSGLASPHDSASNTASGAAGGGAGGGTTSGGGAGGDSASNTASGGYGAGGSRTLLPMETGKGTYSLAVKPAGQHAMAALVNLAELPANRQRMREAGIVQLVRRRSGGCAWVWRAWGRLRPAFFPHCALAPCIGCLVRLL
mgnify:CR=1 FL=1